MECIPKSVNSAQKVPKLFKIPQMIIPIPDDGPLRPGLRPNPKRDLKPKTARKLLKFHLKHNYPNPGALDFDMNWQRNFARKQIKPLSLRLATI